MCGTAGALCSQGSLPHCLPSCFLPVSPSQQDAGDPGTPCHHTWHLGTALGLGWAMVTAGSRGNRALL